MESFRAYLKQTKIFFIACVFMAAVSTAVICLYQLPLEAAVYLAVLWLGAGAAVFLYGYACYRQKVQNLILVEKAPEINLDRLGETMRLGSHFRLTISIRASDGRPSLRAGMFIASANHLRLAGWRKTAETLSSEKG